MEEDLAIKKRLVTDEKDLKRLIKKVISLKKFASDNNERAQAVEALEEEIELMHLYIDKQLRSAQAQDNDLIFFEDEHRRIEGEIAIMEGEIEELKGQLEQAKIDRTRKDQYDSLAKEISKFPSRDNLLRMIEEAESETLRLNKLQDEIQRNIDKGATAIYDVISQLKQIKSQTELDLVSSNKS